MKLPDRYKITEEGRHYVTLQADSMSIHDADELYDLGLQVVMLGEPQFFDMQCKWHLTCFKLENFKCGS